MTAAEGSFYGIAKQSAKGTVNSTHNDFTYLLFREGAVAPNNLMLPLEMEIGGGALPRSMVKAGVTSGGMLDFIPRPKSLGIFLMGALGKSLAPVQGTGDDVGSYSHVFTLPADQFVQPYYTLRGAPAGAFGEQFQDMKVATLAVSMRAANYMEGAVSFMGGLPKPIATTDWAVPAKVDGGPQFLAPLGKIELPTGTTLKVNQATLMVSNIIPLDEQWVIGSYSPDDFALVQRSIILQMRVKFDASTGGALYKKLAYEPVAGSPEGWAASVFKEGRILIESKSDMYSGTAPASRPHSLKIEANGQTAGAGNVFFSVEPIALRAGSQIMMNITAMFMADPTGTNEPIKITLINNYNTQY
jgi:hypothetical protein